MAWRRGLLVAGILLAVKWLNPVSIAIVEGRSMEPTLHDGQFFLIDRMRYRMAPVSRGDVIAFRHVDEVYIKRVAAVGGDALWVFVSPGGEHTEIIQRPDEVARLRSLCARYPMFGTVRRRVVPPGELFVMGDHRSLSLDSRDFGPVPVATVIGRAYW